MKQGSFSLCGGLLSALFAGCWKLDVASAHAWGHTVLKATFDVSTPTESVEWDSTNEYYYFGSFATGTIGRIDGSNWAAIDNGSATIDYPFDNVNYSYPSGFSAGMYTNGSILYVNNYFTGQVVLYDVVGSMKAYDHVTVMYNDSTVANPNGMCHDPSNDMYLYVTDAGIDSVTFSSNTDRGMIYRIDLSDGSVMKLYNGTADSGDDYDINPNGCIVSDDGILYAAELKYGNTSYLIAHNISSGAWDFHAMPAGGDGIAVTHKGQYVWVTNPSSGYLYQASTADFNFSVALTGLTSGADMGFNEEDYILAVPSLDLTTFANAIFFVGLNESGDHAAAALPSASLEATLDVSTPQESIEYDGVNGYYYFGSIISGGLIGRIASDDFDAIEDGSASIEYPFSNGNYSYTNGFSTGMYTNGSILYVNNLFTGQVVFYDIVDRMKAYDDITVMYDNVSNAYLNGMCIDPSNPMYLYVTDTGFNTTTFASYTNRGNIYRVNLAEGTSEKLYNATENGDYNINPNGCIISEDGILYASEYKAANNTMVVYNISGDSFSLVPIVAAGDGLALTNSDQFIWMTTPSSGILYVARRDDLNFSVALTGMTSPADMDFNPDDLLLAIPSVDTATFANEMYFVSINGSEATTMVPTTSESNEEESSTTEESSEGSSTTEDSGEASSTEESSSQEDSSMARFGALDQVVAGLLSVVLAAKTF